MKQIVSLGLYVPNDGADRLCENLLTTDEPDTVKDSSIHNRLVAVALAGPDEVLEWIGAAWTDIADGG